MPSGVYFPDIPTSQRRSFPSLLSVWLSSYSSLPYSCCCGSRPTHKGPTNVQSSMRCYAYTTRAFRLVAFFLGIEWMALSSLLVESAARNHAGFIVTTTQHHHRILSHSPSTMVGTFAGTARISSLPSIGLRHPSKAAAARRKTRLLPGGRVVGTVLSSAPSGRLLESHDDDNNGRMRQRPTTRTHWPFLERPHERAIFAFYGITGSAILWICFKSTGTTMAAPLMILAETGIALTWASMILAISFLEAWVKFRAPFLRKHVAVDVGRHVFAALNAAELGLCGSLWLGRVMLMMLQLGQIRGPQGAASIVATSFWKYCRQPCFVLPAVATASLLAEVIWIAPRLFLRAKARIVSGFRGEQQKNDGLLPSELFSGDEQLEFDKLAQEVTFAKLPSQQWHRVYALLELVKVGCLYALVVRRWMDPIIL